MKKEKLKVLAVCSKGQNRSRYLSQYLRRQGYSTRFGGLEGYEDPKQSWKSITQKQVDWADVIILVRPRLKQVIKKKFKIGKTKLIVLDVSDSKRLLPKDYSHLKELDYIAFQKKWTRPQLRKAIKPYLPLKLK
jgi:predicted protein tyrosine phosphatase